MLLKHRKERESGAVSEGFVRDMAASFQRAVVDMLCDRLFEAAAKHGAEAVVISGGVAANRELRAEVARRANEAKVVPYIPSISLCTDNAAMITYVGQRYLEQGKRSDLTLNAVANAEIGI